MKLTKKQLDKSELLSLPDFSTTGDIEAFEGIIGQDRALHALKFGLRVKGKGFNVYVSGPPGIGKMTSVQSFLEEIAKDRETPPDWCYLNNFKNPYEPVALKLPAGRGKEFQKDMDEVVERLEKDLPQAFTSEDYSRKQEEELTHIQQEQEQMINQINEHARKKGFTIQPTMMGAALVPLNKEGKPMQDEELQSLSDEEQEKLEKKRDELQEEMKDMQKSMRKLQRKQQDASRGVDRQIVMNVVGGIMDELREKYEEYDGIGSFLDEVQENILENIQKFKMNEQQAQTQQPLQGEQIKQQLQMMREQTLKQYRVNVIVDNSEQDGAPVILELNPRYYNLVGRIEKEMQMGAITTDFTLIKPGAILQANGGYLVIPVEELVRDYYSWDALKRSLQAEELRVEELAEQIGYMTIKTLRPQPIPLDVKVVLVGIPLIHHLLQSRVPDFSELFKVKADFDTRMDKVDENIQNFLGFITNLCKEEDLLPIDREGTGKLLEHVIRMADHKERISTEFGSISDIIREADYWAGHDGSDVVTRSHVEKALDEKEYRSNLVQHHVEEMIQQGTLLINTEGTATGQVNGLSIMMLGDYRFGRPNRITATVYPGKDGLVDIEREVKLGGPIHSKGIMILGGYLGMKYSREKQLSISARLVFEQSYVGIDGDSASQAELYTLISALSGVPLKQGIAVTGSVNQHGEVQAIGGVNEKIEGYFSVCKKLGLNGEQGVLIPESNIQNLILKDEVLEAIEEEKFNIWAVSSIDAGIEILTGKEAGALQEDGSYPEGSVNRLVSDTLESFGQVTHRSDNNR